MSVTSENLHLLTAINYYSRMRFITTLLPQIKAADSLRRVIYVAGGGKEGPLDETDIPALKVPLLKLRGHLTSLVTLALESVAKNAPEVSFVHDYPGTVDTQLSRNMKGVRGVVIRSLIYWFGRWLCVPIEESGERHVYLATSAKYPATNRDMSGVGGVGQLEVAVGTSGAVGSGVYSVGWDCESASSDVRGLLAGLRGKGMVEKVWDHTEGEFRRITGSG